jgi:geranylgeranyl pyrophosphate synthase
MSKSLSTSGWQIQIVGHINQMIMETAYGQHLDTKSPDTEQAYWEIAHAKSCPFFGLSFYLGAIAGGATLNKADAIMKLGRLYGEIIQIHDDLNDCLSTTIGSDWLQKKSTLPILFARITDHPERRKFMALMEKNINDNDLHEAQEILIRSGALSFCVDQIVQRHRAGQLLMAELNLPDSVPLVQIFDGVILPIWNLLETQD